MHPTSSNDEKLTGKMDLAPGVLEALTTMTAKFVDARNAVIEEWTLLPHATWVAVRRQLLGFIAAGSNGNPDYRRMIDEVEIKRGDIEDAAMPSRAEKVLETLEHGLAPGFVSDVEKVLRQLRDDEINTLYLMTHTDAHLGEEVHVWTSVLMPIIDHEQDLRRDIAAAPGLGPVLAPELYRKGGGHELPF